MDILDRFSTHLRETLTRGIGTATELYNSEVEPIHLFFALLAQKGSIASEIMNRLKIDKKKVEQIIVNLPKNFQEKIIPTGKHNQTAENVLPAMSVASRFALEKAMSIAHKNQHNYIGTEHLLAALVQSDDALIKQALKESGVKADNLEKQLETVLNNATQFPKIAEMTEALEKIQGQLIGDSLLSGLSENEEKQPRKTSHKKKQESALDYFATNLTSTENQKNIDPVIGREMEIERLVQILCRRTKNNPVLLGEPGVGKTAIVEGLAKKIFENKEPALAGKKIYALDMGLLIAGTIYRGEFEARLKQVIDEISEDKSIILFIDEIHNIVGAGSNQGTMDAANILKPALARGLIHCIGATTPTEFKKHIENDPALERRFQPIFTRESGIEESIKILNGIKENYEKFHNVKITNEAVEAAVKLSERYIPNKFLPDKAIDILDETASALRLRKKPTLNENKLLRLKQKLEQVLISKEKSAASDNFSEAAKWKDEEKKLAEEIKITENIISKNKKIIGEIGALEIAEQVAKICGTKPQELLMGEKERMNGLKNDLKKYILGQDEVLEEVSQGIIRSQLGIADANKPTASFFFVGESGSGKTELAKSITKALYPAHDALIRLDMSEFNESFGVSKLLGSPAGYIGYKESNQFTDRVKMNPHSVILFDEIDKAHRDVVKLLLQILESGEITDSTGKKISLRQSIIILTATTGVEETKNGCIGFGNSSQKKEDRVKIAVEKLKEHFSAELINRIDKICLFNHISPEILSEIADLEIKQINERLKKYKTAVQTDKQILDWLARQLPASETNARSIRRLAREEIEKIMSEIILKGKIKSNFKLTVEKEKLMAR
ncbi:MAG: ATP-dependent Clp protease ATP-binding subunit [Patescibacteria group bacterium]|nr:ATP-dependent Clp protease ATP-binding subunit [Patescibacteria group bacterium]